MSAATATATTAAAAVTATTAATAAATAAAAACIGITQKGKKCNRNSSVNQRCKKHNTMYERENPPESKMLVPCNTKNARSAMQIFEKCRNKADFAFMLMFGNRKIYNPSFNLNKFITGGCAEEIVSLLFIHEGFECKNVALERTLVDLTMNVNLAPSPSDAPSDATTHKFEISLKNSSSIKQSPVLENYRGQKNKEIRPLPPTFIIYTEDKRFRIVYLDHDIIKQGYPDLSDDELNAIVYKNSDSNLAFKSNFLPSFIPRLPNEYILNANFPQEEELKNFKFEDKSITVAGMKESKRQLEKNGIQTPDGFFPPTYFD